MLRQLVDELGWCAAPVQRIVVLTSPCKPGSRAAAKGFATEERNLDVSQRPFYMFGRLTPEEQEDSDLVLSSEIASRQHAALLHNRSGESFIVDLKSRHGTWLGSKRLEPLKPERWQDGAVVKFCVGRPGVHDSAVLMPDAGVQAVDRVGTLRSLLLRHQQLCREEGRQPQSSLLKLLTEWDSRQTSAAILRELEPFATAQFQNLLIKAGSSSHSSALKERLDTVRGQLERHIADLEDALKAVSGPNKRAKVDETDQTWQIVNKDIKDSFRVLALALREAHIDATTRSMRITESKKGVEEAVSSCKQAMTVIFEDPDSEIIDVGVTHLQSCVQAEEEVFKKSSRAGVPDFLVKKSDLVLAALKRAVGQITAATWKAKRSGAA